MTCSPFSAPEVSGDDDVVADVTSGDDVIDEVPVLGTWVHPFVRHLEHVLVTMRLCSAHKLRSLRPLPLMCPTHFHLSKSIFHVFCRSGRRCKHWWRLHIFWGSKDSQRHRSLVNVGGRFGALTQDWGLDSKAHAMNSVRVFWQASPEKDKTCIRSHGASPIHEIPRATMSCRPSSDATRQWPVTSCVGLGVQGHGPSCGFTAFTTTVGDA